MAIKWPQPFYPWVHSFPNPKIPESTQPTRINLPAKKPVPKTSRDAAGEGDSKTLKKRCGRGPRFFDVLRNVFGGFACLGAAWKKP